MKVFRQPARADTSVEVGPYQFLKQDGLPVDLTAYDTVELHVKRQGDTHIVVAAEFVSTLTGIVTAPSYEFEDDGVWQAQFVAIKPSGQKLHGEPAQFRVVKNVVDAALTELLAY